MKEGLEEFNLRRHGKAVDSRNGTHCQTLGNLYLDVRLYLDVHSEGWANHRVQSMR